MDPLGRRSANQVVFFFHDLETQIQEEIERHHIGFCKKKVDFLALRHRALDRHHRAGGPQQPALQSGALELF